MTLQERTPVPILQNEWEFDQLLELFRYKNPGWILEIGTFFGGTLWHWLKEGHRLKSVTCLDLPITPNDGRYSQMIESRNKWKSWIADKLHPDSFHDIKGDSKDPEIVEKVRDLNSYGLDFLFIDGDHSYEGVKADYDNYHDLVWSGGMIVFHDIVGYWTVKKFWDEIKVGKKYIEICNSGPEGWGIGVLYV